MDWYTRIKNFYNRGFWTKEMVGDGVKTGTINEVQYKEITGDDFPE